MIRVADYLMQRLYSAGVGHVFTVTGRGALFLTDALAASKDIETVCVHHEQAAAYAAVAYGDRNEGLGACLVSTGCAGTNTITGILNAWQDNIPCIFIMGQNKLEETSRYTGVPVRTYGQQEADLVPVVDSITKYATLISDPKTIAYELDKAIHLALEGRKGPVWLEIPLDVQNMRVKPEELERFDAAQERPIQLAQEDIGYVVDALQKAKRPVVLSGSGIHSAGALTELKQFVENNEIPHVYAASAPDVYGRGHDLSIGSVGTMGCTRAGNFTVQNSDLVLVIGCRINSFTTGGDCNKFARGAKVIVVDIDPVEHQKKGINIEKLIVSDAKLFLGKLNDNFSQKTNSEWLKKCLHWKQIFPICEEQYRQSELVDLYELAEVMCDKLPANASLVTDSGLIELILPGNVAFKPGQRCIHPASQGSMGAALPAILGAHFASDEPVVCVVGDGSIMMNLQELMTISFHKIPAKIFVINNNAYSVIRRRQVELFGSRTIGTDPSNGVGCPDFSKVAMAFDLGYFKIEDNRNLAELVEEVMALPGPVLCEVMAVEDQSYIASSYAKNSKRRLVQRPIEDQKPYLDRDIFLAEMLIEPIDQ